MKRAILASVAWLAMFLPVQAEPPVALEGLDAARARAQRENKPIFLLSMFGRLDEEWC
ncbi:MAG: hypothetical protein AB1758_13065 [Candidatus Eremiobacterota bacterium]